MLGPSGLLIGQIFPYCEELMYLIEKAALSLEIPPVPITVKRLRLSISERGFVWSRIVESCEVRKNSLIEAIIGRALIRLAIETGTSGVIRLILSLIERSSLKTPTRNAVVATNSPTLL